MSLTEQLASAEAEIAHQKRLAAHNRQILDRLRSGNIDGWMELQEVLAERPLVQVIADLERRVLQHESQIAESEAELNRLQALYAARLAPKPGSA